MLLSPERWHLFYITEVSKGNQYAKVINMQRREEIAHRVT